ncbi:MAG: T9SS type A sorting domain-containing protein [Saprospiraceae bacterium]
MNTPLLKYILIINIYLLFSLNSVYRAQVYNIGAKWHYGILPDNGPILNQGLYSYQCFKDTLINNELFAVINYNNRKDTINRVYYINESNGKYYYWKNGNKNLLFNSNINIGDTVKLDCFFSTNARVNNYYSDTIINLNVIISNIEIDNSNEFVDDTIRSYELTIMEKNLIPDIFQTSSSSGHFTEKIISNYNDYNRDLIAIYEEKGIPEGGDQLRCFNSNDFNYKNKYIPKSIFCEYDVSSQINYLKKSCYGIFLNQNYLKIESISDCSKVLSIEIVNSNGLKSFYSKLWNLTNEIPISNFTPGVYIIIIKTDVGNFIDKFIKS